MKTQLKWFVVPCVTSLFAGNAITLHAQDSPKKSGVLNVALAKTSDDFDAKSIRDKVAKELESSGVAEEIKAKILSGVDEALSGAAKGIAKKGLKATIKKGGIVNDSITILGDPASSDDGTVMRRLFSTQLFKDPKGESYRIGVQCVQMDDEEAADGADVKPGLEVQSVFDDSPASKAGIKEGDVLVTVDAKQIKKISDLTNALQEAGKKEADVAIELKRDDKTITLKVKPTKMKSADLELENIQLSLPTGGYVLDEPAMKSFQEQMKKLSPTTQLFSVRANSDDIKKDMEELKSELAEMKKMLRDIVKSVNEKK